MYFRSDGPMVSYSYLSCASASLTDTKYSKYRLAVDRLTPTLLPASIAVTPELSVACITSIILSNVIWSIPFVNFPIATVSIFWMFANLSTNRFRLVQALPLKSEGRADY